MGFIDWAIISIYFMGMIGLSIYLGRDQKDQEDYYVGGRSLPWWAIGISTMATQTSAISFISKPAFVALKPGGGLTWLQFELALPLAIVVVMVFLLPFFRKLQLISVYEYLEMRYNSAVRYLISGVFLISRGMAAGVVIYATAIVLAVCLSIPLWATILLIGIITVIYDTIGGIKAVVYSDVIQMAILLLGIVLCITYAIIEVGDISTIFSLFPAERLKAIDLSTGIGDESQAPFWGILLGGFFLYISYYGTDQSQVQRELSATSAEDTKKSLFFNGIVRFPLTASYMLMGIAVGAVYVQSPDLQAAVPDDNFDYMIPQYILLHIPVGLRAILFSAILAAAMSSLDSALNSLSAATMRDFITRKKHYTSHKELQLSKITTVLWGLSITAFAFAVNYIEGTVVEVVNKIGSAFYGPIVATFLIGVLSKRVNSIGIFTGIILGVGVNLYLWLMEPSVYWMWWNLAGCVLTAGVAYLASFLGDRPSQKVVDNFTLSDTQFLKIERKWLPFYIALIAYFFVMLAILFALS
jgi:SSS family solute:Na+ symporter